MLTATEIVKQAFREGNLLALSTAPTPEQEAEAMTLLNGWITGLYGFELGEFAFDWPVPPSATSPVNARYPMMPGNQALQANQWPYPPGNVRILLSLVADVTLYLPQTPNNGARVELVNVGDASTYNVTLQGNGRLVKGAASVTDTPANFNGQRLLYRADLGDWKLIETLEADDVSPLPSEYDDLMALGLLTRLMPRYGRTMMPETARSFIRLLRRLKAEYRQPTPTITAKPQPFITPASDTIDGRGSASGELF